MLAPSYTHTCVTSHRRTAHPAALRAKGRESLTPVTGPEWPVIVLRGFSEV